MKRLIYLFAAVAFVLTGCSEGPDTWPVDPPPSGKPFINLSSDGIEFDLEADTRTLDVDTNVTEITCKPFDKWCEAGYANGVLTVSVSENNTYVARKTTVEVRGGNLVRQVFVTQNGIKVFAPADIFTDGTCSELKPGIGLSDIDKITDGFYKTLATGLFDGTYEEFKDALYKMGETPLPRWVREKVEENDAERYQTIFARHEGAVAAPTPGVGLPPPRKGISEA